MPSCSWTPAPTASDLAPLSRETAPVEFLVTADPWLVRHITSFQSGIPVALRAFWLVHDPKPPRELDSQEVIDLLLKLIVESGRLYHLELLRSGSRFFANGEWHRARLDSLAEVAAANHRADILQWMLANGLALADPHTLWRQALQSSRSKDGFDVLELLHRVCPLTEFSTHRFLPDWLFKPTVPLLRWINATFPTVIFPKALACAAAADRDFAVLGYLLERQTIGDTTLFRQAYHAGHYDVLEFLVANCAQDMTDEFAQQLVRNKSVSIQAIVHRHSTVFSPSHRKLFLQLARVGDRKSMQALHTNGAMDTSEPFSVDPAGEWEGLDGLEYLHEHGMAIATSDAMDRAAEAKRWDVVEFLRKNRSEGCTARAVVAAVDSGQIKWVRLLLDTCDEGGSSAAMDRAAASGSMEILQHFHNHSTAGCTSNAMDLAATHGYLRVVQFLHENRTEGCSTDAIDGAARGGHPEVVKYLCEHRTEGCTVVAVQTALEKHHVDVVQELFTHFPDLFGPELLSDLLLRGAFTVFMSLREAFPEQAESVVEPVMFEAGKQFELRTIRFILTELRRFDLQQLALDGAACCEGGDSGPWEQSLYAIIKSLNSSETSTSSFSWLLHPLLRDAQTSTWAVRVIFNGGDEDYHGLRMCESHITWPMRAICHRDIEMLRAIQNVPPGTTEPRHGNPFLPHFGVRPFSFDGARAAAVRLGDKATLEWLLKHVELPIEPTLLSEAVYNHQFEIAEWLAENYPSACMQLDWTTKGREIGRKNVGLRGGLLDWLEDHESVRKALPFADIIDFAARDNDVESLRRLYTCYPELFTPRPSLVMLADLKGCRDTINFLLEIGWSPNVFFNG